MNETERNLYDKATKRLRRCGHTDPTSQIVALEMEIGEYRTTIQHLQERLDDQHLQQYLQRPLPRPRHAGLEKPYIELRPTCSECGAVQENVACGYEQIVRPNITDYEVRINPAYCQNCGAVFGYVVFQGELPKKENNTHKAPPAYMDDRTESGLLED